MRYLLASAAVAALAVGMGLATPALAIDSSRIESADKNVERLAHLPRHLQSRGIHSCARSDRRRERRASCKVAWMQRRGSVDSRPAVVPARGGRRALLYGLVQPVLALDGATGEVQWSLTPSSTRISSPRRPTRPTPRRRARERQGLCRHRRRPADRARHDDRQACLGHEARRVEEADRGLHGRAARREGQGHHRRARRRVALARTDLRRRRQTGEKKWEFFTSPAPRRRRRLGATNPGAPAAAAAGCRAPTTPGRTWSGGARQPGAALRLGRRQVEDRRAATRATTSNQVSHRARSGHGKLKSTSRSCRTTRGTSTARSASSC